MPISLNQPSTHAGDDAKTTLWLFALAAVAALLHILTNGRYGFHRDELQFLSDALHLDWGFVAYPPLTPFIERVSLSVFGLSLVGLRLASVCAQAAAIVVTGLMARELGGARLAELTAAAAVALSALPIFEATEFQYSSFDYLWWTLTAYFLLRLINSQNPRWWLAIGATLGLALETKYTVLFLIGGLLLGLVVTPQRRWLRSPWFYAGVAITLFLFLPNFLWQYKHEFISKAFLTHIHIRDVRQGRAQGFLLQQLYICVNPIAVPLCIAGLVALLRSSRYRVLAFLYLVPFLYFWIGKGRAYYVAAAYPILIAAGAAAAARWLSPMPRTRRLAILIPYQVILIAAGIGFWIALVPIQPLTATNNLAIKVSGDLREEVGWDTLVQTVATLRDSLPTDQQQHLGIVVRNYGEQGAIELLGPALHLPPPISMTNSAWLRGYPTPQPTTIILLGFAQADADHAFQNCRLAAHNGNPYNIRNEESRDNPDIFLCGPPRTSWPTFWEEYQSFG